MRIFYLHYMTKSYNRNSNSNKQHAVRFSLQKTLLSLKYNHIVIRGGVITLVNSNPLNPALSDADAGGDPGVGIDVEATESLTLDRSQIITGSEGKRLFEACDERH